MNVLISKVSACGRDVLVASGKRTSSPCSDATGTSRLRGAVVNSCSDATGTSRPRGWLLAVVAGLGLAAFGAEQSLGTVGVTEISSSLSNTIIAVSYDDLGGADGMLVSNLVKTTNLTLNDKLLAFKNDVYESWILKAGTGGAKFWEKQANTFTVGSDGQLVEGTGASAATTLMGVGTGIWLCRQDTSKPFYLYGKPADAKSVTVAANTWTLVGNPNQTEVTLASDRISAVSGDQLVMFGENGKLWNYTYATGLGWRTIKGGKWDATPPVIGAGLGFWIRLANGGTINW